MNEAQLERIRGGRGFIAALDQSGGSTPATLARYGIGADEFHDDAEMFALAHALRARIVASPVFTSEHVLGAILFLDTLDREIGGRPSAEYLWGVKGIVPFAKVDQGLEDERAGIRLMKPIAGLDTTLERLTAQGVFGTKMRSLLTGTDDAAVRALVAQQFALGRQILAAGLVPILEPEVVIEPARKVAAEQQLKAAILTELDALPPDARLVLKLALPAIDDFYADLVAHPNVLRLLALSGGASRQDASQRLARNHGVIASFSRAFLEGLARQQTAPEFDAALAAGIEQIAAASQS